MLSPDCGEDLWYANGILVSRYEMTFAEAFGGRVLLNQQFMGVLASIEKAEPNFTKEGELELTLKLQLGSKYVSHSLDAYETRDLMEQAAVVYVDELEHGVIHADVFNGTINGLFYNTFRKE